MAAAMLTGAGLLMQLASGIAHAQGVGTPWIAVVSSPTTGDVTFIDTGTNAIQETTHVSPAAYDVAITPDGSTAYVTNPSADTVSVLDTATGHIVHGPIAVGEYPTGIAITPDGKTVYVTNDAAGSVSVINTAADTVTATIPVGNDPFRLAITPDDKTVYVTESSTGDIKVISTATNTVTGTIALGGRPLGIAITPDGKYAYVANYDRNDVAVIDTTTNTVTAIVPGISSNPVSVAISPDGKSVYVGCDQSPDTVVISTVTNTVTGTIEAGTRQTYGSAVAPDGKDVYLANYFTGNVYVASTATNSVTATAGPVDGANGLAITPDQAPFARLTVTEGLAGQPTTFDASASTVKYGTIASYQWDLGDGTIETTDTPVVTHVYDRPGYYPITLIETSSGGTSVGTFVYTGQTASRVGSREARVEAKALIRSETSSRLIPAPPEQEEGDPVILTAHVTCPDGIATGAVEFRLGDTILGTEQLADDRAELTVSDLPLGEHVIAADYEGNETCAPSTAQATVTIVRLPPPVDTQPRHGSTPNPLTR